MSGLKIDSFAVEARVFMALRISSLQTVHVRFSSPDKHSVWKECPHVWNNMMPDPVSWCVQSAKSHLLQRKFHLSSRHFIKISYKWGISFYCNFEGNYYETMRPSNNLCSVQNIFTLHLVVIR